jgi:adhesin transport system outer membrane protein
MYGSVKGNRAPKVYLDAGGSVGEDVSGIQGQDDEVRALLTFSWDLYTGGSRRATQRREYWQVQKAEELVVAAKEEAVYRLQLLRKEAEGSQSSVKSLGDYVNRLEGVLADYRERFKVGRQELLNILDIESELYNARSRLIDAKFNAETSAYRIAGAEGHLATQMLTEEEIRDYLDRIPEDRALPDEVGQQVAQHFPEEEHPRTALEEEQQRLSEPRKRFKLFGKQGH